METDSAKQEIQVLDNVKKIVKTNGNGSGKPVSKNPEKGTWATKNAIGSLFRAEVMSTDPGQALKFSVSLIATVRAALIQKLEDRIPDHEKLPFIFSGILKTIVRNQGDLSEKETEEIDSYLNKIFLTENLAVYGMQIYRDVLLCDNLHQTWRTANKIYVANKAAWNISNDLLSDISIKIIEIIVRHDLMQLPKDIEFNLDNRGDAINRFAKALAEAGEST
jgi:hypothetical protein